jgi:hypothetical protein
MPGYDVAISLTLLLKRQPKGFEVARKVGGGNRQGLITSSLTMKKNLFAVNTEYGMNLN